MVERLQRALDQIPGYTGYRDKERRRDEDRAVRQQLAASLDAAASDVEAHSRNLANRRRLDQIQSVEALFQRISHLANRVRAAPSGYAGLFSNQPIDEAALDQLRRFDERALAESATLAEKIAAIRTSGETTESLTTTVTDSMHEVDRLTKLWDHRGQVVQSARPTAESEVIALLDAEPTTTATSASLALTQGSAIAIFGDNYIVTRTLHVAAPPQSLVLARMDDGPEWLLQLEGPRPLLARVTEGDLQVEPAATAFAEGQGRASVTTEEGESREAAVSFAVFVDDFAEGGNVKLALDWGSERREYRGKKLHASDVEVFGQPTG